MSVHIERHLGHRLLLLICRQEDERKVNRLLDGLGLPVYYQARGQGTAPSELLDRCGLQGTARLLTVSVLPSRAVPGVLAALSERLFLHRRGFGIAVTMPVTGMQEVIRKLLEERCPEALPEKEAEPAMAQKDSAYSMILVASNAGYSDEVIDAARAAGARGGTVIRGRRRSAQPMASLLGVSTQEEQEFIMVIVPQEKKSAVMVAVTQACGLHTEAHGVVLAIPVDAALGME